ncbi:MAG: DNA polymerase III subunit gamma/tau, partial [Ruminococcus sp.]|nr:DNA polymerase III subunit gamma/tau [Ruminococcus sp.]
MYQVLYRKYRPQTFEDVVGQPQVTVTLKNELKSGRINHAYLFTGSRGTGKTTCAKILSKAVNCLNLIDSNPCGECESCRAIDSGEVLDIVEMDAASNRRIDDIRDIIDEVAFTPAKAKYRVYIIDEVHMLTTEAFNALLKTLEEPPKHVIFILATTEVHKLPATITSRCQRFDFHRIAPKDIAFRLQTIAKSEGFTLTDEAAQLIAVIADGALRDAISLLDRSIGIAENEVTAEIVRNAAGLANKNYLFEMCTCTINKNPAKALSIIDRLYAESKDIPRLCDELISHFRSLMMIKTISDPREILAFSDKEFEAAVSQCDYMSLADIVYSMDVLSRSFERMNKGANNRTEFEMAIVKLCSPQLDATTEALTARVASLEKAVKLLESTKAVPQTVIKTETAPASPVI